MRESTEGILISEFIDIFKIITAYALIILVFYNGTLGNAFGQSYGLLNNRASIEVMKKVRASKYKYDILPCGMIHDALYYRFKDDLAVIKFLNDALSSAMSWQDTPELKHDVVKLSGELDLFYPSWKDPITLPNNISEDAILEICIKEKQTRKDKNAP